jgi:hypothetical protein
MHQHQQLLTYWQQGRAQQMLHSGVVDTSHCAYQRFEGELQACWAVHNAGQLVLCLVCTCSISGWVRELALISCTTTCTLREQMATFAVQ